MLLVNLIMDELGNNNWKHWNILEKPGHMCPWSNSKCRYKPPTSYSCQNLSLNLQTSGFNPRKYKGKEKQSVEYFQERAINQIQIMEHV